MASENTLLIRINGNAKKFLDELEKVQKRTKETEKILKSVAKSSAAAFAVMAAGIAAVTREFANFETALVGVGKTTNLQGQALRNFGKEVQGISRRIPIATNELLAISQAAGQLGVRGEANLLKFTETVAKLGVTTDLAGEEAAIALTRLLTVTGQSIDTIDVFGSQLVALGNTTAATEKEILRMANEVARSTAVFNVNAGEAAALGAALRSVGVRAELGGSAVGRAFRAIDKAVRKGGEELKVLEQITGVTGDQLKKTFEEDSVAAFQLFIEGLGRMENAHISSTDALAALGLKGEEILKVLPVLAKRSDVVAKSMKTQADEAKNATALNEEAARAFSTLASDAKLTRNAISELGVTFGTEFAVGAKALSQGIREVVLSINDLNAGTISNLATFVKWTAAILAGVAAAATFALASIQISAGLSAVAIAFFGAQLAAGSFWAVALGPIGVGIAGLVALGGAAATVWAILANDEPAKNLEQTSRSLKNLKKQQDELNKALAAEKALGFGRSPAEIARLQQKLEAIDKEISKLEELRQTKIRASEDFGTGELLVRPEADGDPTAGLFDLPGDTSVEAPFAIDETAREAEVAAEQKKNEEIKAVREKGAEDRVAVKRAENEALRDLIFAQAASENSNITKAQEERLTQENEFALQRAQLKLEETEAKKILDEEERTAALENNALKNQLLTAQENEFREKAKLDKLKEREEEAALNEELRALDLEQRAALNNEDLEILREQIDTEEEADREFARSKAARALAARKKEQQDTRENGVVIAKLNKFFASEEVQGLKRTTTDLEQLKNSSSKKQQRIGRIAARVNAAIKTAEGAISAYTSLAGIPFVGPGLGAAAAGLILNFGLEQQRNIDSAQRGGIVGQALGGARDRVPALLEPGELVTPRALVPDFIQAVGRPEVSAGGGEAARVDLQIGFTDNAFDLIEARHDEQVALGIREPA